MKFKPWMAWGPGGLLALILILNAVGEYTSVPGRLTVLERGHSSYKDEMTRRVDALSSELAGLRTEVSHNARRAEDSYQRLIAAVTEGNAQMKATSQQIGDITAKQMLLGEQIKNTQVLIDSLSERAMKHP